VKLAIAELYQENREPRQQLEMKTIEVSAMEGHEGNVTWIKGKLIELQDTIIYMCKAQRMSEERYAKNSRECKVVEEKARVALTSKKKKQY